MIEHPLRVHEQDRHLVPPRSPGEEVRLAPHPHPGRVPLLPPPPIERPLVLVQSLNPLEPPLPVVVVVGPAGADGVGLEVAQEPAQEEGLAGPERSHD